MPLKDWLAALAVITAWGLNFVVIKLGLSEVPPLLLGALRFGLVAVPAVFFIRRPAVPWHIVVLYGLTISLGQFVFLFVAMSVGMPAGLASIVLQSQAFFTVLIAAILMGEGVRWHNVLGMLVAAVGLGLIQAGAASGTMTLTGFMLTLVAALSWATGNIVVKRAGNLAAKGAGQLDMLSLVVWGALIPPLPFLGLSLYFEGAPAIVSSLHNITYVGVLAVFYLAVVATVVGYSLWGRLLARHPASKVAPLSLLIPVLGLLSSSWLLGERLTMAQWLGGLVVMVGLAVNVFGQRLRSRLKAVRGVTR
ncbi:EamA family transporter [Allopusillimonas ginsengisoli]|uniref:EamA family transporter n=1 Tax=Allopusillimonas ginsengisoli TaxID=453575 RepID=UPI0010C19B14|nr:O-acetylserine/cysteine exporter [Allopusillimonas ginsengisoli]